MDHENRNSPDSMWSSIPSGSFHDDGTDDVEAGGASGVDEDDDDDSLIVDMAGCEKGESAASIQ